MTVPRKPNLPIEDVKIVFWSRTKPNGECLEWTAGKMPWGYGVFRFNGKMISTHRMAYQFTHGPIPPGLCVCHKCDNRLCVKPEHLFLGTYADNNRDARDKGRTYSKLNPLKVLEIRKLASQGVTQAAMAAQYGVTASAIGYAVSGRNWSHVQ